MAERMILTEEGKRYLRDGLPEKRLFDMLGRGGVTVADAKEALGSSFAVALQWAKKYGVCALDHGMLKMTTQTLPNDIALLEEALRAADENRAVSNDVLRLLESRKLVARSRERQDREIKALHGKDVNELTADMLASGAWKHVRFRPYNTAVAGRKIYPGKRQPYAAFLQTIRAKLAELGFMEMASPLIETEFWNFDALYQPQNHPSRDWTQTYSLKQPNVGTLPAATIVRNVRSAHENGWKTGSTGWGYAWDPAKAMRLMPRAHTTAASARTLAAGPSIPGKYYVIGRCFRPDVIDATHGVEFNQVEGIVVDASLTFRHLLGILKQFAVEIAGAEKIRFFADYYPFTEPSVQMSAKHPKLGWIEFGGAGMFREELTRPLGVDVPVIAWGLGMDRLALFKLGLNDVRELFSQNIAFLREAAVL